MNPLGWIWRMVRRPAAVAGSAALRSDEEAAPFGFNQTGHAVLPDQLDLGTLDMIDGPRHPYDGPRVKADPNPFELRE